MTFSAQARLQFYERLGDSWCDLADYLGIPSRDQERFPVGDEPRAIWRWLGQRQRLTDLPVVLIAVHRQDLADVLESDAVSDNEQQQSGRNNAAEASKEEPDQTTTDSEGDALRVSTPAPAPPVQPQRPRRHTRLRDNRRLVLVLVGAAVLIAVLISVLVFALPRDEPQRPLGQPSTSHAPSPSPSTPAGTSPRPSSNATSPRAGPIGTSAAGGNRTSRNIVADERLWLDVDHDPPTVQPVTTAEPAAGIDLKVGPDNLYPENASRLWLTDDPATCAAQANADRKRGFQSQVVLADHLQGVAGSSVRLCLVTTSARVATLTASSVKNTRYAPYSLTYSFIN